MASSGKDVAVSHRLAPRRQALLRLRLQIQKRFRRPLRRLMRPTFGAAKVGKTAHAAKAPGKLRRVPCDARSRRDAPNSLPSVAQTCGASFSAWPCASRRPRGRWGGRRTLGGCRSVCSQRFVPATRRRRRRVSQPRTGHSGSACLSDQRERVRNRPSGARNAGNRTGGCASSRRTGGVARQRFLVTSWGARIIMTIVTRISRRSRRRKRLLKLKLELEPSACPA